MLKQIVYAATDAYCHLLVAMHLDHQPCSKAAANQQRAEATAADSNDLVGDGDEAVMTE